MRLLNVDTLQFREFSSNNIPRYFVTSHRWTDDEVTYKEVLKGRLKGFGGRKVELFCTIARDYNTRNRSLRNVQWIWIDTCCIDKSSSAEVSKSINSMWKWYSGAQHCLAYLHDVNTPQADDATFEREFQDSEWFHRGWTLQELLAPRSVIFLSKDWKVIGRRDSPHDYQAGTSEWSSAHLPSLTDLIAKATGIPEEALCDFHGRRRMISDIEKVHWVEKRRTTEPEDIAYCMLGIFGVHMPLIYGEGEHDAWERLKRKVSKRKRALERQPLQVCANESGSEGWGFGSDTDRDVDSDYCTEYSDIEYEKYRKWSCTELPCRMKGVFFRGRYDLERHKKGQHHITPTVGDPRFFRCAVKDCEGREELFSRVDKFRHHVRISHPSLDVDEIVRASTVFLDQREQ